MSPDPTLGISDPVSSLSHFLGALLCLALARPLAQRAPKSQQGYLWVFTASAVFLLTMSGLFHWLPRGSESRELVQRFDHAGIFILIAGTVTAGHGLLFRGGWRWGMIAAIWVIGLVGLALKVVYFESISEGLGLALYLTMGWLGAATMVKLALAHDWQAAGYLFAGGVVYTAGAVGDVCFGDSLTLLPGILGSHELFHLTVLGGLAIHWRLFHEVVGGRQQLDTPPTGQGSVSVSRAAASD